MSRREENERNLKTSDPYSFEQTHSGRAKFPGGEWGESSEFEKNSDLDLNELDDEFTNHEYDRSRFADTLTPETLRKEVYSALSSSSVIDATQVKVTVQEGIVTLSGNVESPEAKKIAEILVTKITGVTEVRNELNFSNPH